MSEATPPRRRSRILATGERTYRKLFSPNFSEINFCGREDYWRSGMWNCGVSAVLRGQKGLLHPPSARLHVARWGWGWCWCLIWQKLVFALLVSSRACFENLGLCCYSCRHIHHMRPTSSFRARCVVLANTQRGGMRPKHRVYGEHSTTLQSPPLDTGT